MRKGRKILLIGLWASTGVVAICLAAIVHVLRTTDTQADAGTVTGIATDAPTGTTQILFDAPTFSLTDENGQPFQSGDLAGRVWVADFIFTNCSTLCPMMTQNMALFQKSTPGSPVQMVSFSVDPETDTPAVLKKYAATNMADESRWHFLTGTRAQTWEISKGMKLAVGPDTGNQVIHSSHFLLVDGKGKVRGIYDVDTPGFMKSLVADSTKLASSSK